MPHESALPELLARQFQRVRHRLTGVSVASGVGLTLFVTGLVLAAGLMLDLTFDLPLWFRLFLLIGAGISLLASSIVGVIVPLFRKVQPEELAAIVETAHPGLNERLLSTIELSQARETGEDTGSPLMQEWLLEETISFAKQADFADAVDGKQAIRRCWLGGTVLLALLLPLVFATDAYAVLVSRFFNPWGNYERIQNLVLTVREADRVTARNEDVRIKVEPSWRFQESELPESVWLEWRSVGGDKQRRRLDWDQDENLFVGILNRIEQSFEYSVFGGGARTKTHFMQVVDRPEVVKFSSDVTPPPYTGEPAERQEAALGEIACVEQSQLEFQAAFNKPIVSAELLWLSPSRRQQERPRPVEALDDGTEIYKKSPFVLDEDRVAGRLSLKAELDGHSGQFAIRVVDEHGLTSPLDDVRQLTVLPDEAPLIQFADREQYAEARTGDVVEIPVVATDDFGLAAVELHYDLVRSPESIESLTLEVPRANLGMSGLQHLFKLDLTEYQLMPGMQVTFRARATDERPVPFPNETWTETRSIQIKSDAKPYGESTVSDQQHRTEQVMENLQFELEKQKNEAKRLQDEARQSSKDDEPWESQQELGDLNQKTQELQEQFEKLGALLEQQALFEHLGEQSLKIGEEQLQKAQQKVEQAQRSESQEREQSLGEAASELDKASKDLQKLQDEYHKMAMLQRDLLELNRLAANTERLAEHVDELMSQHQQMATQPEPIRPEQQQRWEQNHRNLFQEHQQLSQDLDNLLSRRPDLIDAARNNLKFELAQLAREAEKLARQQNELAEATRKNGEQSANEMVAIHKQQSQLNEETKKLASELNLPNHDDQQITANESSKQARESLEKGNRADAVAAHRRAEHELNDLAQTLENGLKLPQDPGEAAQTLADRQRDLIQGMKQIDPNASERERHEQLAKLGREQTALSLAAEQLPRADVINPSRDPAVNKTREAAQNFAQKNREAAQDRAQEAANLLQQTADILKRNSQLPQDPVEAVEKLAERQQQLADSLAKISPDAAEDERNKQLAELSPEQAAVQLGLEQLPAEGTLKTAKDQAVDKTRKATDSVRAKDTKAAAEQAKLAAEALRQFAEQMKQNPELAKTEKPDAPPFPGSELAQKARELAQRQGEMAKQLEATSATSQDALPTDERLAGLPSFPELMRAQEILADQASRLEQETKQNTPQSPDAQQRSREFAQQARQAAEAILRMDKDGAKTSLAEAAESAKQAATALNEASDNEVPPTLREFAEIAAAEQQRISEQMQQLAELQSTSQMQRELQQSLQEQTSTLTDQLTQRSTELRAPALDRQPRAEQAERAATKADEADQSMQQAIAQMANANQGRASEIGKQAAETLRQAAQEAKDSSEHHNPDNAPENTVPGEVGQQVAHASQFLEAAGEQLSQLGIPQQVAQSSEEGVPMDAGDEGPPPSSPEGDEPMGSGQSQGSGSPSEMLRQAAQSMRKAAGEAGMTASQQPGQQSGQNQADASAASASSDFGNEALAKLIELEASLGRMSERNWGELPGELQSELMESSSRRADGDYARLIRRYFQEISRARNPLLEESSQENREE
ncbi:MAG: hypothetical protein KDA80_08230 [Planctomycetaceae bacterium]|nr:hypothetical protein [Planctomycetaceae bacterium]